MLHLPGKRISLVGGAEGKLVEARQPGQWVSPAELKPTLIARRLIGIFGALVSVVGL